MCVECMNEHAKLWNIEWEKMEHDNDTTKDQRPANDKAQSKDG